MSIGTPNTKNLVIVGISVLFLCTACRTPMPGEDLFGEQNWDTFSRARTADAYAVAPQQGGPIAGETTFASSSRRDPQAMHRIWAFLQDYKTYEAG